MTSTVPPRDWTEIHWPTSPADAARWIAVLPLAATEQHGPHLPLETDVMIGEAYLARVRELLPRRFRSPSCRCSRSAFPPNISIIRAR
jgi:creatinine amidohydrolase